MANQVLQAFLVRLATGKNVLLLLALFLSFTAGIMPALESDIKALSGGVGVLDLEFFYSPETAFRMLNAYGPEGIRLYLVAQWSVDLIFPVIGALLFATALIWVGAQRWYWLGPLLMVTDWTENVLVTLLLVHYPDFNVPIAMTSCFFTLLKWTLIGIMNLMILFYGGKKWIARYRRGEPVTSLTGSADFPETRSSIPRKNT